MGLATLAALHEMSIIGLANNRLSGSLPNSLGNLGRPTRLSLHANAGLCAPDTDAFSEWLDTVPDKPGGVQACP